MPKSKTKIGFSIDSIVGEDLVRSPKDDKSDFEYTNDYQTEMARVLRIHSITNYAQEIRSEIENRDLQQRNLSNLFEHSNVQRERSNSPSHNQSNFPSPTGSSSSPHRSDTNQFMNLYAGPIRPLPIVPQNIIESNTIPPYINLPGLPQVHNSQYMQAQFQMAAAFVQQQAEHGFGSHPPHGKIFPHGFPRSFPLHPSRKPRRGRTAYLPSQLLKLEHAFESNQYAVGTVRKELAQSVNLSEAQVKIWFQNRRTKHKRMKQEEDSKGGNGNNNSTNNDGSIQSYHEDDMIDMEDCFIVDDSTN